MKKTQKAPAQRGVIRVATVQNPTTKRNVLLRVTSAGGISGARYVKQFKVSKVTSWVEVVAKSWAQATKLVRAGKGKKVAP